MKLSVSGHQNMTQFFLHELSLNTIFTAQMQLSPAASISHCLSLSLTHTMIVSQTHRISLSFTISTYITFSLFLSKYTAHTISVLALAVFRWFVPFSLSQLSFIPLPRSLTLREHSQTLSHTQTRSLPFSLIFYML